MDQITRLRLHSQQWQDHDITCEHRIAIGFMSDSGGRIGHSSNPVFMLPGFTSPRECLMALHSLQPTSLA